jgi:hypothetical protein
MRDHISRVAGHVQALQPRLLLAPVHRLLG